ncbi:MAG: hypothetical protein ACR2HP_05785 [Ilumatobacteraceae bacterium]
MRTIQHPLSGATYDLLDDGNVQVVTKDGSTGTFDKHGHWLSGDLKHADAHLCLWIGGIELPNRFQQAATALKEEGAVPSEELTQ